MNPQKPLRTVAAGAIGNILEWYDFAIYGYFAAAIGKTFFPREDHVAQVLAAFGIFAVGYLMRPLGGVIVGHIGDRLGRRAALSVSVAAMAIPTFLVGVLPGYEVLGELAPILLTVLRVVQGLSIGGEYTTSIVFLVEHARPDRRGLIGAMASFGATGGMLLGSATGAVLAASMPVEALNEWGWRIPFLLGLLVGLAGFLLRRHVADTLPQHTGGRPPLIETVRHHGTLLARLAGLSVFLAVSFYLVFLYVVDWLQYADGIAPARALSINTASMLAILPVIVCMGWLSDRIGRKPVMLAGAVIGLIGSWPLFWLMHHESTLLIMAAQFGFVLAIGMFGAVLPVIMVELTPPSVRCTAIALGYNVPLGIIGGLTPLAATWLVHRTGNDLSPAYMLMAASAVARITLLLSKESYRSR